MWAWCGETGGTSVSPDHHRAGRESNFGLVIGVTFLAFRAQLWRAECGRVRFIGWTFLALLSACHSRWSRLVKNRLISGARLDDVR